VTKYPTIFQKCGRGSFVTGIDIKGLCNTLRLVVHYLYIIIFVGSLPFLLRYIFNAISKDAESPLTISSRFVCTTALLYHCEYDEFMEATNAAKL